jgi:hypothetical protein
MNSTFVAAALALIFGVALIRYYRERWKKRQGEAPAGSVLGDDGSVLGDEAPIEMERVFLDEVAAGKRAFRIASVYNQYDIMFIKSLFQSEQIPYYFEFENMSKLRTGIPVFSFNNALLNVLEGDYDDAYAVLKAYKERPDDEGPGDTGARGVERIRNVAELAIGGWKSPSPGDRAIELYDRPDTGIGDPHGNDR